MKRHFDKTLADEIRAEKYTLKNNKEAFQQLAAADVPFYVARSSDPDGITHSHAVIACIFPNAQGADFKDGTEKANLSLSSIFPRPFGKTASGNSKNDELRCKCPANNRNDNPPKWLRQRLASFCSCRYPVSPRPLSTGPLHSQNIARLWLDGRARRNRLSSRCSGNPFPPLDPPWLENVSTVAIPPEFADAKELSFRLRELPPRLYRSV